MGVSSFLLVRLWTSRDDDGEEKQFNAMIRSIRYLRMMGDGLGLLCLVLAGVESGFLTSQLAEYHRHQL